MRMNQNILLMAMAFFTFGVIGTRPLIPLYARELGATSVQIGFIISLFSILPLVFSIHIGKFIDRTSPIKPLIISTITSSVFLITPYFINNFTGIILSQIFVGLSNTVFVVA